MQINSNPWVRSSLPLISSQLNEEQSRIFEYVNQPDSPSIFLTGSAGTGKSYLLGKIIQARRARYFGNDEAVAVTAPTGIAASNINGKVSEGCEKETTSHIIPTSLLCSLQTIHSFAGVGLAKGNRLAIIDKVANARTSRER